MMHEMNLNNDPYNKMKAGTKTVEMRLYDEKRQLLKEKDLIKFTNRTTGESMVVEIEKLYKYNNFEELYRHFDKISIGYNKEDKADPKDMDNFYSKQEQLKYGVLGIKIKKL